jgi:hypothetical protein
MLIEATSKDAAEGFHAALSAFSPELLQDGSGAYRVQVSFRSSDEILGVLNALRDHVTGRDAPPTRVEIDGYPYMLHAD